MAYYQVKEILQRVRNYHRQLRNALENARCETEDDQAEVVLRWAREDEQQANRALADYSSEGGKDHTVLETWLQYVPDEQVQEKLANIHFTPEMSAEEIVARVLEFDEALTNFYQQLADQVTAPRVKEFFDSQVDWLQRRKEQGAWTVLEMQDHTSKTEAGPQRVSEQTDQ